MRDVDCGALVSPLGNFSLCFSLSYPLSNEASCPRLKKKKKKKDGKVFERKLVEKKGGYAAKFCFPSWVNTLSNRIPRANIARRISREDAEQELKDEHEAPATSLIPVVPRHFARRTKRAPRIGLECVKRSSMVFAGKHPSFSRCPRWRPCYCHSTRPRRIRRSTLSLMHTNRV